jgi:hypothetical protein
MDLFEKLLEMIVGHEIVETPETTDLHLTREQFMEKMLKEKDGQALLDLLEREYAICEKLKLTNAYYGDNNVAFIDVPKWNTLVAHLSVLNSVFAGWPPLIDGKKL